MDDDTLHVEFPLGPDTVVVRRPKPAALVALQLTRAPGREDKAAVNRTVRRIFLFLEGVTGAEEYAKIDDGMLAGEYEVTDVLDLIDAIVHFDWITAEKTIDDPAPVPRDPDQAAELEEMRRAVAAAEALKVPPTIEQVRGPRVVGRG